MIWSSPIDGHVASGSRNRAFEMTHCDTPVILDISLWEYPRPDNRMIITMITGWILVGMVTTLVWHGNLCTATAHSWMCSAQIGRATFGVVGELNTPEKRLIRTGQKCWSTENFMRGSGEVLYIVEISIDFHQLWGETDARVWWFQRVGGSVTLASLLDQCTCRDTMPWHKFGTVYLNWQ